MGVIEEYGTILLALAILYEKIYMTKNAIE